MVLTFAGERSRQVESGAVAQCTVVPPRRTVLMQACPTARGLRNASHLAQYALHGSRFRPRPLADTVEQNAGFGSAGGYCRNSTDLDGGSH